jgi:hypothetical protein
MTNKPEHDNVVEPGTRLLTEDSSIEMEKPVEGMHQSGSLLVLLPHIPLLSLPQLPTMSLPLVISLFFLC